MKARLAASAPTNGAAHFDESTWQVAAKVLESLAEMSRARNVALVVVYLPAGDDYTSDESDPWRERLRDEAERAGFAYVDLIPEFRDLSLRLRAARVPARSRCGSSSSKRARDEVEHLSGPTLAFARIR